MSTCNWLDLEPAGSRLILAQNPPPQKKQHTLAPASVYAG